MGVLIRKIGLGLSIFLTAVVAFSASAFAKPVALNIVLDDQVAILASSSDILQKLFAEHSPGTEFRKVVVRVPRLSFESETERARIHAELKEKIRASLAPGDELKFLILNTHGETVKHVTSFRYLGLVTASGPDDDFQDLFDAIKDYAAKDLAIISGACSVFADGQDQSLLRARGLLAYFGASDGFVYGSKTAEVDTLRFRRSNFSVKNSIPPTLIAVNLAISSVASLVVGALLAIGPNHLHTGIAAAGITLLSVTAFQYLLQTFGQKLNEALGRVNVGYLFEFRGNDIKQVEIIHKMKDLTKSFGLKRGTLAPRCEALFR